MQKTDGQVQLQTFLALALDGGEWSDPNHLIPRETAPGTHWI